MSMLQFGAAIDFPAMPSKLLVGWLVGLKVVGVTVVGLAVGFEVGAGVAAML